VADLTSHAPAGSGAGAIDDLGTTDGRLDDGRPWVCRLWRRDGHVFMSFFVPVQEGEKATPDDVLDLMMENGLVNERQAEVGVECGRAVDDAGVGVWRLTALAHDGTENLLDDEGEDEGDEDEDDDEDSEDDEPEDK
jgi:hypothetical protein